MTKRVLISAAILLGIQVCLDFGLSVNQEVAAQDKPGEVEINQLFKKATRVEPAEGRRLLQNMIQALAKEKKANLNRQELAGKLAEVLPRVAQTRAEVSEVLGPHKEVSRQVFYRRYRESWVYQSPLPLVVLFDGIKGQEAKVITVRPLPTLAP